MLRAFLQGHDSYSDMLLAESCAGSSASAQLFLTDLADHLKPYVQSDFEDLR